jgi:hypothetical protein
MGTKMSNKWKGALLAGALSLFLAGVAQVAIGQDGPPPPPEGGFGDIVGVEMGHPGHVVKGAPFSGQTTVETVETLADGTHIDRKMSGSVSRDSQGRTRREMTMPFGPAAEAGQSGQTTHSFVMIQDPVAGKHFILEPDKKVAREMRPGKHGFHGEAFAGGPGGPGGPGGHGKNNANTTTESLGTQTIDGVSVTGTKTVHTIPAGQMGNDKPLQIVTERWYSPALQVNVKTVRTDPFHGTTTYQLTNISHDEPASTLFTVPADYTIKQGPMRNHQAPAAPAEPAPQEQQ